MKKFLAAILASTILTGANFASAEDVELDAAALTVLNYFGDNSWDEMKIASEMKTSTTIGTDTAKMVKFFKKICWNLRSSLDSKPLESYGAFQKFVLENLQRGRPILVENVEWGGQWLAVLFDVV